MVSLHSMGKYAQKINSTVILRRANGMSIEIIDNILSNLDDEKINKPVAESSHDTLRLFLWEHLPGRNPFYQIKVIFFQQALSLTILPFPNFPIY